MRAPLGARKVVSTLEMEDRFSVSLPRRQWKRRRSVRDPGWPWL